MIAHDLIALCERRETLESTYCSDNKAKVGRAGIHSDFDVLKQLKFEKHARNRLRDLLRRWPHVDFQVGEIWA